MYSMDTTGIKQASAVGSELKDRAKGQFRKGSTAALSDLKAAMSALQPPELAGKLPANWLPRTIEASRRGIGKIGTTLGVIGAGITGFFRNRAKFRKQVDDELNKVASYTVEHVIVSGGSGLVKNASALSDVKDIMQKVYEEEPSYWPYGLGVDGHESVYLIRDNMTKAAAGFVGWQEQRVNGRKIGSYSIGILPEYRSQGFAKEAVAKILLEKSARVDEVRSYICSHNMRSKGLANGLGVTIQEKF